MKINKKEIECFFIIMFFVCITASSFDQLLGKKVTNGLYVLFYLTVFICWLNVHYGLIRQNIILISILLFISYVFSHIAFVANGDIGLNIYIKYSICFMVLVSMYMILPAPNLSEIIKVTRMLILTSTAIIIILLCIHFALPNKGYGFFGRRAGGIYASVVYLFVTVLLIGHVILDTKIFNKPVLYLILLLHGVRVLLDLRRSPVAACIIGVIFMCVLAITSTKQTKYKKYFSKGIRKSVFFCLITTGTILILFISMFAAPNVISPKNLGIKGYKLEKRFTIEKLKYAFIKRIEGVTSATEDWEWSPFIGKGLGSEFDLPYTNKIHGLYFFIIGHLGFLGLFLFSFFIFSTFVVGLLCILKNVDLLTNKNSIAITGAFVSIIIFYIFSSRGVRFDSMAMFCFSSWALGNLFKERIIG